jgi:hypothetical protein
MRASEQSEMPIPQCAALHESRNPTQKGKRRSAENEQKLFEEKSILERNRKFVELNHAGERQGSLETAKKVSQTGSGLKPWSARNYRSTEKMIKKESIQVSVVASVTKSKRSEEIGRAGRECRRSPRIESFLGRR